MPLDYASQFGVAIGDYVNSAEHNDRVHADFTTEAASDPLLHAHRAFVEARQLGFGDPAFHAMWRGLLATAVRDFGKIDALEIGVYKGQVISLWALLAQTYNWPVRIHAISPLEGQPLPGGRLWQAILFRVSSRFRERVRNGDFYSSDDYESCVRSLFARFSLDFSAVNLSRGYSTDPRILAQLRDRTYHVIYVDGDHTFEGASHDIANFATKVVPNGWLVMDDAGCDLPGTTFWKGHEAVSRASQLLPGLGFKNVLNVGHNRIFRKQS